MLFDILKHYSSNNFPSVRSITICSVDHNLILPFKSISDILFQMWVRQRWPSLVASTGFRCHSARFLSHFKFLDTGKSAFTEGRTDLTLDNADFLRSHYIQKMQTDKQMTTLESKPHFWKEIRCGAVGVKLGSYPLFYKDGTRTVASLVQLLDTEVVDVVPQSFEKIPFLKRTKLDPNIQYYNITVGCRNISPEWLTETQMQLYKKHGICCKEKLSSFICTEDAILPPGTKIRANHFVAGQLINIWGRSMDRGFQGPMKRWNFRGMPATHGTTKSRRAHGSLGSTGQRRVMPGKRMAGQMGDKLIFKPHSRILRINTTHDVIYIEGLLPGLDGNFISIRDSRFSKLVEKCGIESLPFPTNCEASNEQLPADFFANDVFDYSQDPIVYEIDN